MMPIALFKNFLSSQFIASVKVSNIARCSSLTNKLRDTDSIGWKARNITILTWEIDNFKNKIVTFIINFGRKISLEIDKCKFKNAASVSEEFPIGILGQVGK